MSILEEERLCVKESILFNPSTIEVTRAPDKANAGGVLYKDWVNAAPVAITNPVRVCSGKKPYSKVEEKEGEYSNDEVYWIIADHETTILKYDRFDWYAKKFEIQDVEPITIDGGIKSYQAKLIEKTQGTA